MYLDTIARTGSGVYSTQNTSYANIVLFSSNKYRNLPRQTLDSVLEYISQNTEIIEPPNPRIPPPLPPMERRPPRRPPIPPGREEDHPKRRGPIIIPNVPDEWDDGAVNRGYMIKAPIYVVTDDRPIKPTKPDYAIDKPISPVGPNIRPPLRMPPLPIRVPATKNPSNPNDDPAA